MQVDIAVGRARFDEADRVTPVLGKAPRQQAAGSARTHDHVVERVAILLPRVHAASPFLDPAQLSKARSRARISAASVVLTGAGTPISAPIRGTAPLITSISQRLPAM